MSHRILFPVFTFDFSIIITFPLPFFPGSLELVYREHTELLHRLVSPRRRSPEDVEGRSCKTYTLVTIRDHLNQSTKHMALLANGHNQSARDYEKELGDFTWVISTIRTRGCCLFSEWFQKFVVHPATYAFISQFPTQAMDLSGFSEECKVFCAPTTHNNLGVEISKGEVKFILKSHSGTTLDSIMGYFNPEAEVSKDHGMCLTLSLL